MRILPCTAPSDVLEPAPLTDLSIHMDVVAENLSAFWGGDDAYYVRASRPAGMESWYRIEANAEPECQLSPEELQKLGTLMSGVLPIGAGRVAFPVGSSGRTVYRIWRTRSADNQSRTKIRAIRAARSRRLPA